MRVVVTGAGGFVGGHLVRNLVAAGHRVAAASKHAFEPPEEVTAEELDVLRPEQIRDVVARHDPEGIVHLAAQPSVPRSWEAPGETYATNIIGSSNLLEALRDRPGCRVVLVGSAQVYGSKALDRPLRETDRLDPGSPYALSKVAQEVIGMLYAREFGLAVMATRSFNHTGPGQSTEYAVGAFASQVAEIALGAREPVLHVGWLDARRDFLDVRDVVDAYRLLVESGQPGEAYNVASGKAVRIGDLLATLLDLAELTSAVEVIGEGAPRAGDPALLVGDPGKIEDAVGWRPAIPIEASLADTLEWYRVRQAARPLSLPAHERGGLEEGQRPERTPGKKLRIPGETAFGPEGRTGS